MTIQDLIARAAPALSGLDAWLSKVAAEYPDLAPAITPKLEALRAASSAEGLFNLGTVVMKELAALPSTGLDPRAHPSDLAG